MKTRFFQFLFLLIAATFPANLFAQEASDGLTLSEAINLAVTRNERAAAAAFETEAAEARVGRARAFFFPDVTVTSSYTRRAYETIRNIGGEDVTISSRNAFGNNAFLSGTIFNARAFPLLRQARLELQRSRGTLADERRLVSFEAADAFVTTLSTEQVQSAAARRSTFARASLDDARARFDAGLVSSNDVTKAELELATAERELARANGNSLETRLALENLLNTAIDGPLVMPEELLVAAAAVPPADSQQIANAIQARPDIAAGRFGVAALRAFASEPLTRLVPSLNYNGQYRQTNEEGISGRDSDWSLGLALSWTMFDGGEAFAERRERRALVRAAELDQQLRERSVDLAVRSAVVNLESEQASIRQATVAADVARRNADETLELYRQGLASALEVADANIRRFEAEVAEVRARYQLALAYLDYRAASGETPLTR